MNGVDYNPQSASNAVRIFRALLEAFNLNPAATEAVEYAIKLVRDEERRALPRGWSANELRRIIESLEKRLADIRLYNSNAASMRVCDDLADDITAAKFLYQRLENPQTLTIEQDSTMNDVVSALAQIADGNDGVVGSLSYAQAQELARGAGDALGGLWSQLSRDEAPRGPNATPAYDEDRAKLMMLRDRLRDQARRAGPGHAWWDIIFDVEAFLDGREPILKFDMKGWIEHCEGLIKRSENGHEPASPPAKYELGQLVLIESAFLSEYLSETYIMERKWISASLAVPQHWKYRTNDGEHGDIWYAEDQIAGPAPTGRLKN